MKTIGRNEMQALLADPEKCTVLDVQPQEYYAAGHLSGAKNCCVYEVTFLEEAAKTLPDKAKAVAVYGSSHHSLASHTAGEKLEGAGYTNVLNYREGFQDWQEAGLPVERNAEPPPEPQPRDGRYRVDTERSALEWIGRSFSGAHQGAIAIREGWLEVANGQAVSGEFTLDMNAMTNVDLADSAMRRMLIAHLQSDDFFDVARYPTAVFRLRSITANLGARPGGVNADVVGSLTLKGVTEDVGFPATIGLLEDGVLSAEAHFDIDRTRWNVLYGSGKFYEKLGKHLVHDVVTVGIRVWGKHEG